MSSKKESTRGTHIDYNEVGKAFLKGFAKGFQTPAKLPIPQQEIVIEADSRDVEKYHRGLFYTISTQDISNVSVVCKSRYKLKNGQVRLKFLTAK